MVRPLRAVLTIIVFLFALPAAAQTPPQILDPNIGTIREYDLSPDGSKLVLLAERDGRKSLFFRDLFSDRHHVLGSLPGLVRPNWNGKNRYVYAMADKDGDEHFHLYSFDTEAPGTPPRDLTPYPGKRVVLVDVNNPDGSALVGINLTSPETIDLYRVAPDMVAPKLVQRAIPGQIGWMADMKGQLFGRSVLTGDGRLRLETRLGGRKDWQGFTLPQDFTRLGDGILGHGDPLDDGSLWLVMRGEQDVAVPQRVELATGKVLEAITPDGADTDHFLFDKSGRPVVVQSAPGYPSLRVFDPALRKLLQGVPIPMHSYIKYTSFNIALTRMIFHFLSDIGEENIVYVDREQGIARILHKQATPFLPYQMPRNAAISFKARDELTINGYLTIPPGQPPANLPLILLVHGGPWARDGWGFDARALNLALQGYAVLRVNFRGSGGYGRTFENAGKGEWGGKMQDDLTDAACWAIGQGIADPGRMLVMGASYGGYAALMALERTPNLFVAAIEEDGLVDLRAHLGELPPYARPFLPILTAFIGQDAETQWERSPLAHVERIERPVLAFHGTNDSRVQVSQLRKLEQAMRSQGKDITAIYFDDEGHGVSGHRNMGAYLGKIAEFIKSSMANPQTGDAFRTYCDGKYIANYKN